MSPRDIIGILIKNKVMGGLEFFLDVLTSKYTQYNLSTYSMICKHSKHCTIILIQYNHCTIVLDMDMQAKNQFQTQISLISLNRHLKPFKFNFHCGICCAWVHWGSSHTGMYGSPPCSWLSCTSIICLFGCKAWCGPQ